MSILAMSHDFLPTNAFRIHKFRASSGLVWSGPDFLLIVFIRRMMWSKLFL